MGRLRIQHCIINRITRQYGPHPTSDLLGVDYFHTISADVEYPYVVSQLELFVRFYCESKLGGSILVTVSHESGTEPAEEPVYSQSYVLPDLEANGSIIYDRSFKLKGLRISREGLFSIRVQRRIRRTFWQLPTWRILSTEYIHFLRDR